MRRGAELVAFLGLSVMVHAGAMAGFGASTGGSQAQGNSGSDRITLAAAPESMAELASRWEEPPQVMVSPAALQSPILPTTLRLPSVEPARPGLIALKGPSLPPPEMQAISPPVTDTATPPVMEPAVSQSPRPQPRPDAAPASAPQPARTAQGQGGGTRSGAEPAAEQIAPALSQAERQSLMAAWGGQIMARIERARPRVDASGQVTLSLRLQRNGDLSELSVARSSGNAGLDEAALDAVRRAGRFPAAPDGLREASYAFSLPIRFR